MSQDYSIIHGEVVDTLQSWDLTDYYDACLCDPPYLLEFMGKAFDKQHKAMAGDNDGQRMYQWHLRWCREVYKVLKPGGFVLAFGGTRTSHRLACALEDVGFEVRDTIEWMYGSGFPKSLDISKAIDKLNGDEREVVSRSSNQLRVGWTKQNQAGYKPEFDITTAGSEQSALWSGYGTALKPSHEPLVLAMKPCQGTFAENALGYGVAGLNIDECRIHSLGGGAEKSVAVGGKHEGWKRPWMTDQNSVAEHTARVRENVIRAECLGRWPANLVLSHSPYCQEVGTRQVKSGVATNRNRDGFQQRTVGFGFKKPTEDVTFADENGLETISAWDCLKDGPVKTVGLNLFGYALTPLSELNEILAFLQWFHTQLVSSLESHKIHNSDISILSVDELVHALGVKELPSFRACCLSCLHSCDERIHALLDGGLISSQQLADALGHVLYHLRGLDEYNQTDLRPHHQSNSGVSPGLGIEICNDSSNTPCSSDRHEVETLSDSSGRSVEKYDDENCSNQQNRTGGLFCRRETLVHSVCIETEIRLLAGLSILCSSFVSLSHIQTVVNFEACPVRLLDEQSESKIHSAGVARSGSVSPAKKMVGYLGTSTFRHEQDTGKMHRFGDSGGASRFFYCAKVSTSEREIGLIHNVPCLVCGQLNTETHPNDKGQEVRCTRNNHPTQKPIDLCRYLATLLLPPPRPDDTRKLLVPFSGAGSEVAGSLLAGWDDVTGIEQDAEYVQWSEARVQAVLRGELQERGSGSRSRQRRGRSTRDTTDTVDTVDAVDTSALADLFTEG